MNTTKKYKIILTRKSKCVKMILMFKFISILLLFVNITIFVPCSLYCDQKCDGEHDYAQTGAEHNHCTGVNHCVCSKIVAPCANGLLSPLHSEKFHSDSNFLLIINLLEKSIFHPPQLLS